MGILVEPDLGATKPVITILKKSGRRMVENTDEVYQRLSQALPGCHVLQVEGDQIATMSIRDQVCSKCLTGCWKALSCLPPRGVPWM